jgi:hypothetical protein
MLEAEATLVATSHQALGQSQEDWSGRFKEAFEAVPSALSALVALEPSVADPEELARLNDVSAVLVHHGVVLSEDAWAESTDPKAFDRHLADLERLCDAAEDEVFGAPSTPGLRRAVLVEAFWAKNRRVSGPDREGHWPSTELLSSVDLDSPRGRVATELADLALSGEHVLVRLERSAHRCRLKRASALNSRGDVVLVPFASVGLLPTPVLEVVAVGARTEALERRVEALSALLQDGAGASLRDLFEASEEL